jgi:predicted protein tyrosine phosphatase
MAKAVRVLFVCEGNRHRSPTAEQLYSNTPGVKARSAGTSSLATVEVTDELLAWADVVFVMEARIEKQLRRRFVECLEGKKLIGLDIPDDFQFMQPELLVLLTAQLAPLLGEPNPAPER